MQQAQHAVEALRLVGLPAAAICNDGRVLAVNALFESAAHGVRVNDGRIVLSRPEVMQRYDQALLQQRAGPARRLSIFLPTTASEPPAVLQLIPMDGLDGASLDGASLDGASLDESGLGGAALAGGSLVVITSLSSRALPGGEMLQGLFDLTPAEARLAIGLAGGNKIGELARLFKVSHETIRSQIKQVFAKTRTRSQAELVGLLARLPPFG